MNDKRSVEGACFRCSQQPARFQELFAGDAHSQGGRRPDWATRHRNE